MASDQLESGEMPAEASLLLRRKRALYRAQHRGTKEMDWMVGKFAEGHLFTMTLESLVHFEKFLEVGDTELHSWLFGTASCRDPLFALLVQDIRRFNSLS